MHTILQLPFSIFLMRTSFEAIPREIEEAAVIDGCSTWQRLTSVFLPLTMPGLVTVALFAFINSWNEFLAALIFMNYDTLFTVPILLVSVRAGKFGAVDWARCKPASSSRSFRVSPSISLLQRYYISGLLSGRSQMTDLIRDDVGSADERLLQGPRTIRDVARLAGVSIGTASKALNASGRLSAETRAKILRIAREIEYRRGQTISRRACIARAR